jgi:hypothetical protein
MKDHIVSTDAIGPSLNNWHRIDDRRFAAITRLESYAIVIGTDGGQRKRLRLLRVQSTVITAVISSKMGKRFGATSPRQLTTVKYIDIMAATSRA